MIKTSNNLTNSITNKASNIDICSNKITMGQGEYVVFHKLPNGKYKTPPRETFEKIYKILIQHSPAAIINSSSSGNVTKKCASRYAQLTKKIKKIDENLEVAFVPRTLYELIFIRKCIEEDLKQKRICSRINPAVHQVTLKHFSGNQDAYQKFLKADAKDRIKSKCWHLGYFTDAGDNEHAGVRDVAFRLNQIIAKMFFKSNTRRGLTQQEFSLLAEKEIEFLKTYYEKNQETSSTESSKSKKTKRVCDSSYPGPTTNFGFESTRGGIKPMGIRHEVDAQIIRNALALDCSKLAQSSFFLYRGANFQKDSVSCWSDKNTPYSLAYGTSLFAGCVYDGGASAFHYMRDKKNAYALAVPFDQLNTSLFYIPAAHTITQLFSDGEIFHSRTKAWKNFNVKKIRGINFGENSNQRKHLQSSLSKTGLVAQFQAYKNKAIQLK